MVVFPNLQFVFLVVVQISKVYMVYIELENVSSCVTLGSDSEVGGSNPFNPKLTYLYRHVRNLQTNPICVRFGFFFFNLFVTYIYFS